MDYTNGNMKAIIAFVEVVKEFDLDKKKVCVDPFSHAPALLLTVYFANKDTCEECCVQIPTSCINPVFFDSETQEVIKGFLKSRITKTIERMKK
jgi:hypothetical protein